MQELVGGLPAVAGLIEKGGIIGLLIVIVAVLGWAVVRLRKDLLRTYRQRDKARMISVRYKGALDSREIKVDVSDIEQMFKEDLAEET